MRKRKVNGGPAKQHMSKTRSQYTLFTQQKRRAWFAERVFEKDPAHPILKTLMQMHQLLITVKSKGYRQFSRKEHQLGL